MKVLLAIINARHRREWREAIRATWLPMVPADRVDAFFFVGRGKEDITAPDVVELDCDDSYMGLPDKIRSIYRWAKERGYSHIAKCDDDVVLDPIPWIESEFIGKPYVGRANRRPDAVTPFWVPMGFFYIVRGDLLHHLVDAPLPTEGNDDEKWVAKNMYENGYPLQDDLRYKLQYGTYAARPLRPVVRTINRPLRSNPNTDTYPGTFAWCVFMEGNSGNTISTEIKIQEFHRVFNDQVKNKAITSN